MPGGLGSIGNINPMGYNSMNNPYTKFDFKAKDKENFEKINKESNEENVKNNKDDKNEKTKDDTSLLE